jgi:phospholipase/carboxylesterase
MTTQPQLPLPYVARRPAQPGGAPPLLLLLHGYGSNEHDLIGLAPSLDPRLLILSPRAPWVVMPGGFAWFDLDFTPGGLVINTAQVLASRDRIGQFMADAVAAFGADPQHVYLGGFSQGAILALALALRRPATVAGVLAMSGMAPPALAAEMAPAEALRGLPVLMQHGIYDPVIPVAAARAGRDLLARLPLDLTYREYPMGHEVSAESLADAAGWLRARLER